jgi:6-phosphofructokinase 1
MSLTQNNQNRRLGILTGGGDAPGLNAVIRAATKTARQVYGWEVMGILNGFDGFIDEGGVISLDLNDVRGILPRGGTILGTASRGNPFARRVIEDGKERIVDVSDQVIENIHSHQLDALVVVGGDGTLRICNELFEKGCPVIGVPKTIDNDVGGTDLSFGYDTAVSIATEAIDRLHTTAESHHRVMVLELMGRDAGFITLHAGVAGGADVILIPEIPFEFGCIRDAVERRAAAGRHFSIVAVAEGAHPSGEEPVYRLSGDEVYSPRLGGIGQVIGDFLSETCQMETRVTVLGHLQRGGSPTAFDRWLATRYGAAAVRLAVNGAFGEMVCLRGMEIASTTLESALAKPKRVDLQGDGIQTARDLGICLGDDPNTGTE